MRGSERAAALSLLLAVAACGFEAPPPKLTPPPPAPRPPVSTVAATLEIPVSTVVALLNERTQTALARIKNEPVDCAIAKCSLDLVATRTGPITGGAADGKLSLDVPLTANAALALKTPLFKTKANSFTTGVVHAETAFFLAPDWHLRTGTQGTVELSQAQLKLGPLKMSFADLWNRDRERLSRPLFKVLDRHVATAIKIRAQAERLWSHMQHPIHVGKSPSAWLVLEPERLRVSPLIARNNVVSVSIGVDVRAHVVVSDATPAVPPDRPLPVPTGLVAASNRFDFIVPVLLPYDAAARLALQRLTEKPVKVAGNKVRFEKLQILPSGKDVVVAARFCVSQSWDPFGWFDSCGEGYLRGDPQFDPRTDAIRIAGVHYDIATEGMILAAMRFLAGDALGKALEKNLVFSVGHDIDKLDAEIEAALARRQGRGVIVSGDVGSFGTPSLTWTRDGFVATFPASGTVHVGLDVTSSGLDFR